MGRPKGGKNQRWRTEEKVRLVRRYLNEQLSQRELARQEGISKGMLANWITRYIKQGESGLESKGKKGNPFAALHTSKNLSEIERLRLTVAKQEIEIARLKNGYRVRGGGANKVFVTSNGVSIKSLKR